MPCTRNGGDRSKPFQYVHARKEPSLVKPPLASPEQYNTCFYLKVCWCVATARVDSVRSLSSLVCTWAFAATPRFLTGVSHNRTVYADLGPRLHTKAPEPDV